MTSGALRNASAAANPRVYVLILNWNGWRDTIACLHTVLASDYANFAILVCDNASTDDSLPRLREWAASASRGSRALTFAERGPNDGSPDDRDVDLVIMSTGGNLGFSGGNNAGMRYLLANTDAELVWLLNNDTEVAPSALSELVARAARDTAIGAVGGVLLEFNARDVVQEAGATYSAWHGMVRTLGAGNRLDVVSDAESRLDYLSGGCVLVRTSMLRQVGLLDERFFMYSEDVDWSIRMRQSGFGIALASRAHVWHKGGGSAAHDGALHDYFSVKSALLLIQKHHPNRLPVAAAYSLYRCLLPKVARGQWSRFRAVLRAYRDVAREMRTIRHDVTSPLLLPPPVHGPYTVQKRSVWWLLRITDAVLAVILPRRERAHVATPRRILLATGGHLGDAVMLTASLRRIREALPQVEIGVVLPSWSTIVLSGHPDVRWLHTIDHWKLNRSSKGFIARWRHYQRTRRIAVREIKGVGYDVALDLYAWIPNMAAALREAGIPIRAGFESGGFGPLYTSAVSWGGLGLHMTDRQADVIRAALDDVPKEHESHYDLPPADPRVAHEVDELVAAHGGRHGQYAVVHMGSGRSEALIPTATWTIILAELRNTNQLLLFTGQGAAERRAIQDVIQGETGSVDLSSTLSWSAFVEVIRGARVVACVDTVTAHVAAAVGTPSIVVWSHNFNDTSTRPLAENAHLVDRNVDASTIRRLVAEISGIEA